jgi:hypothetical protein
MAEDTQRKRSRFLSSEQEGRGRGREISVSRVGSRFRSEKCIYIIMANALSLTGPFGINMQKHLYSPQPLCFYMVALHDGRLTVFK